MRENRSTVGPVAGILRCVVVQRDINTRSRDIQPSAKIRIVVVVRRPVGGIFLRGFLSSAVRLLLFALFLFRFKLCLDCPQRTRSADSCVQCRVQDLYTQKLCFTGIRIKSGCKSRFLLRSNNGFRHRLRSCLLHLCFFLGRIQSQHRSQQGCDTQKKCRKTFQSTHDVPRF